MIVNIVEHDEGLVTIFAEGDRTYDAIYDEYTGDWLVTSESEGDIPVQVWLLSKNGAIQYILERVGLIEDGDYEQAPDRCSA